jgi:hypothetical protein
MKELFGQDAYRAIVTQVLPGLIASAPWIIALYDRSAGARNFLSQNTPVATAALFLAALFWGFVCEDLGARAEAWIHSWQTRADRTSARESWFLYLRRVYAIDPPGIRYMRSLVTRMKFELNSSLALFTAAIGLNFAYVSFINPLWLELVMLTVAVYLFWEAWASVALLRELRREMEQPIAFVGPDT